jgi:hypothetical protein
MENIITIANDTSDNKQLDEHKKQSIQALNSLLNVLEQGTFPVELSAEVETAKSFSMVLLLQLTDPIKLDAMLNKLRAKQAAKTLELANQEEAAVKHAMEKFDNDLKKKGMH